MLLNLSWDLAVNALNGWGSRQTNEPDENETDKDERDEDETDEW